MDTALAGTVSTARPIFLQWTSPSARHIQGGRGIERAAYRHSHPCETFAFSWLLKDPAIHLHEKLQLYCVCRVMTANSNHGVFGGKGNLGSQRQ